MLDLERLDSGKAEPHLTPFAPEEFFKRVVNGFQKRAEATGNVLSLEMENGGSRAIDGRCGWLTQMLNNLITNALKFTSEGEVRCHVAWESERLEVEVRDTGRGISPSDLKRILEPLSKPTESAWSTPPTKGWDWVWPSPKNWWSARRRVGGDQHAGGGHDIPICFAASTDRRIGGGCGASRRDARPPLIPDAPVLIVDDNELNVLVARRMVANWGYEVITASNADEAEAQLAQASPFLVLLDIHMPGRDGFEAARDWKQPSSSWGHIPLVGLTADAESHTRTKALESGMDDVVVKPFNPPHLRAVLERFSAQG